MDDQRKRKKAGEQADQQNLQQRQGGGGHQQDKGQSPHKPMTQHEAEEEQREDVQGGVQQDQ
jgi:hypothetical protein